MSQSEAFLAFLLAPTNPGSAHELRTLPSHRWVGNAQRTVAFARDAERLGRGVGITPVKFTPERNTHWANERTAVSTQFLWADIDGGLDGPEGALALLQDAVRRSAVPPPHALTMTGGGYHAIWRLTDPVDLTEERGRDRVKSTLKRITLAIGGQQKIDENGQRGRADDSRAFADPGGSKLTFGTRVPGIVNPKRGVPATLARWKPDDPCQPLVWWRAHLPPLPAPPERRREERPEESDRPLQMPQKVLGLLHTPAPPHTRHQTALSIAGSLAKARFPQDAILTILEAFAASNAWNTDKGELPKIAFWAASHP